MKEYSKMKNFLLVLLFVQFTYGVPLDEHENSHSVNKAQSPVVIFAFSGLRWDVGDLQSMSSLEQLKKEGVWGKRKIDVFQTETLPAFVTMVSGQYPDKHGMLSNNMKDWKTGENFNVKETATKWWDGFEPIWITNQNKENGTGNSALCYWPGHDVTFGGKKVKYVCQNSTVDYVDPFKELTMERGITKPVMPFEERIKNVHDWLKMNVTKRPTFIGVYFEEPLNTMMKYGVQSNETKQMLKKIDSLVSDTVDCFKKDGINEEVTFIVTGESGATEVTFSEHKEIFLEDKLNDEQKNKLEVVDDGPIMTLYTDDGVKDSFVSLWENDRGMQVYTNETIPENFHFSHKERTMPLIIIADEHWRVYKSRVVDNVQTLMGYDGKYPSSHALFVAKGPLLKQNHVLRALGNVDVYGILCKTLNITPPVPHSGNEAIISEVIVQPKKWLQKIEKVVEKIVKTISEKPRNIVITVIVAVLLAFVVTFLIISALYKITGCWCKAPPMLVKVSSKKLLRKRKSGGKDRLLDENELSDSELSSSDEFYFDSVEKRKK